MMAHLRILGGLCIVLLGVAFVSLDIVERLPLSCTGNGIDCSSKHIPEALVGNILGSLVLSICNILKQLGCRPLVVAHERLLLILLHFACICNNPPCLILRVACRP